MLTPLPNCCASDLDGSGRVGANDLLILLFNWGPCEDCDECGGEACLGDLDCNCSVGASDLLILLADWGAECIDGVLTGGGPVPQDVTDCLNRFCCAEEDMLALEKCLCSVDPECDPSP